MIDLVREIREAIMLPDNIEVPFSSVTFRWREDFVEAHRDNARFVNRAVRALYGKHPFRSFKMAVYDHNHKNKEKLNGAENHVFKLIYDYYILG